MELPQLIDFFESASESELEICFNEASDELSDINCNDEAEAVSNYLVPAEWSWVLVKFTGENRIKASFTLYACNKKYEKNVTIQEIEDAI